MSWIQTYTGRKFYPLEAQEGDLDLIDIAHSLSLLCRFNGHSRVFYSVAEHSVRVSWALPDALSLWGLLHDAAEAYLSDLPRPIKAEMPFFVDSEQRLMRLIARHFGLEWPMPAEVALADTRLLVTEARDLMAPAPEPWNLGVPPLEQIIEPWNPAEAEQAYLDRFETCRDFRTQPPTATKPIASST